MSVENKAPEHPQCKRAFSVRHDRLSVGTCYFAWQKKEGGYLAVGYDGSPIIKLYDRQGVLADQISFRGSCGGLLWSQDGDILAIPWDGGSNITLWEAHSQKLHEIELPFKDFVSSLSWSFSGKVLAVGSHKGNLLIYNHRTLRKIPVIGKHNKKIICSAFSNENLLALGTVDNYLSINSVEGDTINSMHLRGKPSDLKFGQLKEDKTSVGADNTVSCVVSEKTLYLFKFNDPNTTSPMELGFQAKYGSIVSHHWHGDGYLLISFSAGFVVLVSSHPKEIGTELALCELKAEPLRSTALGRKYKKIAICYGDCPVGIHDASDPRNVLSTAETPDFERKARVAVRCEWSYDDLLLAVQTAAGEVQVFLATLPHGGTSSVSLVVLYTSLTELLVNCYCDGEEVSTNKISMSLEPHLIAAGPTTVACCVNNTAYIYMIKEALPDSASRETVIKEYNGNIAEVALNIDYIAVRCGTIAYLSLIHGGGTGPRDFKAFPDSNAKSVKVSCISLTRETFLYGNTTGTLKVFLLKSWCEIHAVQMPETIPLASLHPEVCGLVVIVLDKLGAAYCYDISEERLTKLENFPNRVEEILWDQNVQSRLCLITHSRSSGMTRICTLLCDSVQGVEFTSRQEIYIDQKAEERPIYLFRGRLLTISSKGLQEVKESLYEEPMVDNVAPSAQDKLEKYLIFNQYDDSYALCESQNKEELWRIFLRSCLQNLELEYAVRASNHLKDYAMTLVVEDLLEEIDKTTVTARVWVILKNYDMAERLFIRSGHPRRALQMRKDLYQWTKALELAKKYGKEEICEVSKENALSEEFDGNHVKAYQMYEFASKAFRELVQSRHCPYSNKFLLKLKIQIEEGIARTSIKSGYEQLGFDIALNSDLPNFQRECAESLEARKCYVEAAELYKACQVWDRAVSVYIKLKDWKNVYELMDYVHSPKIFLQYAKAKESEGNYLEAAQSFNQAGDYETAVKNFLRADKPDDAIKAARHIGSSSAACQVATYFEEKGDVLTALRFLVVCSHIEDSLHLAFRTNNQSALVETVKKEHGKVTDNFKPAVKRIAQYFEGMKDHYKAGLYFVDCGEHTKAIGLLLKAVSNKMVFNEEAVIKLLIEATIASKNPRNEKTLVEFLLGEKDEVPKDPKYLLTFYIKSNQLLEAAKTAVIVAKVEADAGNYLAARTTLLNAIQQCKLNGLNPPKDVFNTLRVLHYYHLVKIQASLRNFSQAARLCIHVADNLSLFKGHELPILLAAVNQCHRAGMKKSCVESCYALMKPELRAQLDPKNKNMVETMVRRFGKTNLTDAEDDETPCPYCAQPLANYTLSCPFCRGEGPFCIASGRHLVEEDLTSCPKCHFPAVKSELLKLLDKDPVCPMCDQDVDSSEIFRHNDIRPFIIYK